MRRFAPTAAARPSKRRVAADKSLFDGRGVCRPGDSAADGADGVTKSALYFISVCARKTGFKPFISTIKKVNAAEK